MADITSRRRQRGADPTPGQRAAIEEVRARHRPPEARAEDARVREAARKDVPPLTADEDLLTLLATLRTERERQGLSLTDVSDCTGMDRSMISRLELGKIPNPTLATLRAYAGSLGRSLDISARPMVGVDGFDRPSISTWTARCSSPTER
jgi:ribosome-binding protein aMBF1 (putative translation factor)